jgi:ribosome-binding factor A
VTPAGNAGRRRGRPERAAAAIRQELAALVARELADPRVLAGIPSVNRVELNRDGSVARVFVSFVDPDPGPGEVGARTTEALRGLRAAASLLRSRLGSRLRIGRVPRLEFVYDVTAEVGARLSAIVREDRERAAAAAAEAAAVEAGGGATDGESHGAADGGEGGAGQGAREDA